jgi:hypothetical protein
MSRFASLTAGLLARKGEAEPTATPFADQLLTRVGAPAADIQALTPMPYPTAARKPANAAPDVAQGIFGAFGKRHIPESERVPVPAPEPAHTPYPVPAAALSPASQEEGPVGSNCGGCVGHPSDDPGKTFHVNLRVKRLRFVKLKLSAALLRRPVQDIVSEALDQWFEKLPPDVMGDCACLKSHGD